MRATAGLFVAALALASGWAQAEPTAQERSAARVLIQQGDTAWDAGDYDVALDRFTRARQLLPIPSIAFRYAECLEKVGRLVEASETFAQISRTELAPNAPEPFRDAVESARDRAAAIRQRLPMLTVEVEGEDLDGAELRVGGKPIPKAIWGTAFPVDPGPQHVEVVKGDRRVERQVVLEERGSETVALTLPPAADATAAVGPSTPSPAPPPPADPQPVAPPPPEQDSTAGDWQRPAGWVGVGIGGVGLVVGSITGAMMLSKRSHLESSGACTDKLCYPEEHDTVDELNRLRPISTAGFVVGVVGVAAGVTLLLTAPPRTEGAGTQVALRVGIGAAGVEGTF